MTDGGRSFPQIRQMTLHDVELIYSHWKIYPPVRDLVAAGIGFQPQVETPDEPKYMTAEDLRRMLMMTGGKLPGSG